MRIAILGLAITSSWGNGHATTYRALVRALAARGHDVLFLERDMPWYAANRDLPTPPYGRTALYSGLADLRQRFTIAIREADLVIVGSYVPDGIAVGAWVLETAPGVTAFYDIDTPVTQAALARGDCAYLSAAQLSRYDLYLSFSGGPLLERIAACYGARLVRPLYCAVDPALYYPDPGGNEGTLNTETQRHRDNAENAHPMQATHKDADHTRSQSSMVPPSGGAIPGNEIGPQPVATGPVSSISSQPEARNSIEFPSAYHLGYMGTYSPDRQTALERLLLEPARRLPKRRFVVAGPRYPPEIAWPANVERHEHLAPAEHRAFYAVQRFTLSVTRADMVAAGYSPSVRLFEAAACGTPVISDPWPGLETFFAPGREILVANTTDDVVHLLCDLPETERRAIGAAARMRVLAGHTAAHRAVALEGYVREALALSHAEA